MTKVASGQERPTDINLATERDLRRILGNLDDAAILAILDLHATIAEVEEALVCANGQAELLHPEQRMADSVVARIGEILATADDSEDPLRR
jgi:hypothetical protein